MKEIVIEALTDKLPDVLSFIDEQLESVDCPMKTQLQIDISVEEIFVNIANYAYPGETGNATIQVVATADPFSAQITFIDSGLPYNPLEKDDPDITLSAEERPIGGLGIFMVKKSMDSVAYKYANGQNILTLKKGV